MKADEPRPLSKDGEAFRQAIGKAGYEVTPRQLRAALDEALQRVSARIEGGE